MLSLIRLSFLHWLFHLVELKHQVNFSLPYHFRASLLSEGLFPFSRLSRIMSNLQRKRLLLLFWKRNIIYPHKWSITFSHCKELICHSWDQTLIHSNYMVHRIRWQYVIILNHGLLLRQELVLLLLVNKNLWDGLHDFIEREGAETFCLFLCVFFFLNKELTQYLSTS